MIKDPRRKPKWTKKKQLRMFLDKFTCQRCGKTPEDDVAFDVHHKQTIKDRPDLAYDLDNLETVCKPCHIKIHRGESMNKSWDLIKRVFGTLVLVFLLAGTATNTSLLDKVLEPMGYQRTERLITSDECEKSVTP